MISRHWKGIAKPEEADNYIRHLRRDTFPQLSTIEGFINATILKRAVNEGVEFLIVTVWQSLDAIKQFAGENPTVAVVPPNVQAMMIAFDSHVTHYDIDEEPHE
ncbi:MAG: antibiotic biosynthesis monooxygenase [Chloroflexi bacterium]|nr:antibiotic biosynthesis monooxygenase [Chloroflexota bacterium]